LRSSATNQPFEGRSPEGRSSCGLLGEEDMDLLEI
jgi:hypothetical protein